MRRAEYRAADGGIDARRGHAPNACASTQMRLRFDCLTLGGHEAQVPHVLWDVKFGRSLADGSSGQRCRADGVGFARQLRASELIRLVVATREASRVVQHLLLRRSAITLCIRAAHAGHKARVACGHIGERERKKGVE